MTGVQTCALPICHTGKVLQVSPSENKVIVEGQNMVTKHVKPRRQGEQGGIVKAEGATSFPLLKKTLVAFGDQVGFADTLDEALDQVFGGDSGAAAGDAENVSGDGSSDSSNTGGQDASNQPGSDTSGDQSQSDGQSGTTDGKSVDKDEWLMNPQTVNAYYEPSMNVIVFPAAILQPPFFDPKAEDAANYGGIGAVIGHEIGHGFDDQGSQYDGDGKLNNWWTDEDRKNFEARTGALIAQYNSFVPLQLAEKYADEPDKAPHVNGALTIGENIGDLGGVNIALKAYAFALGKAAGKSDAKEDGSPAAIKALLDTAPEMDGFTGLQRFFLSYASIWRTKNRDELAEQYLQIDPHSPAEFRTNGIASNVDLFYDAFNVTEGDAMWLDPDARVPACFLRLRPVQKSAKP